jgi:hypothetical protein
MKIRIEFEADNAAFVDNFPSEISLVFRQAETKILEQLGRVEGCVCTAPEAADKLLDTNGNTVGTVAVEDL